jgi:2-polyprenyl-6-methoxyphenol hydroxylase-like FAD-dependent oxidoreductase
MNHASKTAIVIGGSLGGLAAANLLLRAGWDVQVYERVAEELEGRGAGIVTHPELLDGLRRAGVRVDDSLGIEVAERVTLARDGSVAGRRAMPQLLTAWSRLYRVLKDALPPERYHNGRILAAFEQDGDGVTATFSDGSSARAGLLVAADGGRSLVRRTLLPQAEPRYAGYVAWRGLVEESALSGRTLRELFPYFAFGLPPHEQIVAYPVAGRGNSVEPGRRRYNFVWYRPADEGTTLRDLLTDAEGRHWPDGIPPPLIRPEVLERTRQAAHEVLAPQFAEVVAKTEQLFFQPITDLESPHVAFGRVALLGDAAFVARPHCGMGVTKAVGDALTLVEQLQANDDPEAALSGYEAERVRFGHFIVEHARSLGAYMQAQLKTPHEQAMAERYRTPAAVMRNTAVAPVHDESVS